MSTTAWKHSGAGLDHGKLRRGSTVGVGKDAAVAHGARESLARGNSDARASAAGLGSTAVLAAARARMAR